MLQAIRTGLGLSETELAVLIGVSYEIVEAYEHGSRIEKHEMEKLIRSLPLSTKDRRYYELVRSACERTRPHSPEAQVLLAIIGNSSFFHIERQFLKQVLFSHDPRSTGNNLYTS